MSWRGGYLTIIGAFPEGWILTVWNDDNCSAGVGGEYDEEAVLLLHQQPLPFIQ